MGRSIGPWQDSGGEERESRFAMLFERRPCRHDSRSSNPSCRGNLGSRGYPFKGDLNWRPQGWLRRFASIDSAVDNSRGSWSRRDRQSTSALSPGETGLEITKLVDLTHCICQAPLKGYPLDPSLPWHVGFERAPPCRQGRRSNAPTGRWGLQRETELVESRVPANLVRRTGRSSSVG